jgi:hypothetical protein
MSFVLDNSVALAWCFEDEQTPAVMALLDRVTETGAIAPLLWPLEALNGLLVAELLLRHRVCVTSLVLAKAEQAHPLRVIITAHVLAHAEPLEAHCIAITALVFCQLVALQIRCVVKACASKLVLEPGLTCLVRELACAPCLAQQPALLLS